MTENAHRWRINPYAPFTEPLPVPTVSPDAPELVCIQINRQYIPYITGALQVYRYDDAWNSDPTQAYLASKYFERLIQMFNLAETCVPCPEDDCPDDCGDPPVTFGLRLNDLCILQYTIDNGVTWLDTENWGAEAAACFTGPQGEPGADGDDGADGADGATGPEGPQGEPGEDCECEPSNPPPDPPDPEDPDADSELCGIAVTVVDFMKAMSDDTLSNIAASITDPISIVASIAALTVVGDVIANDLIALFGQIVDFVADNYNAAINTAFIEMCKCEMYCELKSRGGWAVDIWEPWKSRVRENEIYTSGNYQAFELFLRFTDSVDMNEWNARASVGQHSPSAFCELCDCCDPGETISVEWTAIGSTPAAWTTLGTIDSSAWAGDTTDIIDGDYSGATRGSNADWQKSTLPNGSPPNDNTKIGIKYTFAEPTGVARIKWTLQANASNTKIMHVAVMLEDDSMLVVDAFKDTLPTPNEITRDETFDCVMAKEVWFIGVTGAHGLDQYVNITQTTEIN